MIVRTRVIIRTSAPAPAPAVEDETTNGDRILAVMRAGVWYAPKELVEKTGIKKAAAYLTRLSKRGLVRRQATSVTSDRNFVYRRVVH